MASGSLIVTSCGTSLVLNGAPPALRDPGLANLKGPPQDPELRAFVEQRVVQFLDVPDGEACRLSAEINGLTGLYKEAGRPLAPGPGVPDRHVLIATDTWLGRQAAEAVEARLRDCGFADVSVQAIDGLTADRPEALHLGLSHLAAAIDAEVREARRAKREIVFHVTGGFKAVVGYLQVLGSLRADRTVLLFEGGKLLTIPRLPVRLDLSEGVREHLDVMRRLVLGLKVTPAEAQALPTSLVHVKSTEGLADASVWAKALWPEVRDELYRERLWPSPSPRIRFGDGLQAAVEREIGRAPDERYHDLNERLDDLAREREQRANPKRLDFKQMRSPHLGCTHEFDLWADWRAFARVEGEVVVVETIAQGRH